MERAFFDVRVSHPGAPTNSVYETPAEMYAAHEKQKMTKYNHRLQSHSGRERYLCPTVLLNNWRHGTPSYDVCQEVGKTYDEN